MFGLFKRIIAMLCTLVLFIPTSIPAKYSPKNADELIVNAVLLSDVHIEGNSSDRYTRFGKTLTGVFSTGTPVDALVFAGDNTMNGQNVEWFDFYGILCRLNKAENTLVGFGNHDFGNNADHDDYLKLSERCIKQYNDYLNGNIDNVYYTKIINGVRFIMLSSTDNAENTVSVISDEEIEWLKGELAASAAEGMPAVVVNHNLIYGRNGSRSYYSFNQTTNNAALDSALQNCGTDVVYVCGHSHFGVNDGSVSSSGRVTYVNLPSAGNTGNYDAEGLNADMGNGLVMEIYKDSISLRFRNFAAGEWIEGYDGIVIPLG